MEITTPKKLITIILISVLLSAAPQQKAEAGVIATASAKAWSLLKSAGIETTNTLFGIFYADRDGTNVSKWQCVTSFIVIVTASIIYGVHKAKHDVEVESINRRRAADAGEEFYCKPLTGELNWQTYPPKCVKRV